MFECACHLSAALRLSDSHLGDGSGRQWRQRATRLRPTCDYCGDGAQRVRTQCKQYTEPQTTFTDWNTSVRSDWPGTDAEWLVSDQRRGQVPHKPTHTYTHKKKLIYHLIYRLTSYRLTLLIIYLVTMFSILYTEHCVPFAVRKWLVLPVLKKMERKWGWHRGVNRIQEGIRKRQVLGQTESEGKRKMDCVILTEWNGSKNCFCILDSIKGERKREKVLQSAR